MLDGDYCTPEEAQHFVKRLHDIGPEQFISETVINGTISAKKLCTAFRVDPRIFGGGPDELCYSLLGRAIARELSRRPRLQDYKTIDDAAMLLNRSKNILVITGAGVSF